MKQRNDSIAPASKKTETSSVRPRAITLVEAVAGMLAVLNTLRAQLVAHAPSASLAALFRAQISDAQAAKLGERASADVVLADAVADAQHEEPRARTEHASARAKTLASSSSLDLVEGRLRDELMRLRVAVEAQRAAGVALPEVELRGIRRVGYGARPAAPPAPPAPVTP